MSVSRMTGMGFDSTAATHAIESATQVLHFITNLNCNWIIRDPQ